MTAQVAVRSMRQRKVGLLGKTAKHQGKSAEGEAPLAAPPCACRSGTNVQEEDRNWRQGGPEGPVGEEKNWVKTVPGKGLEHYPASL